MPKNRAPDTPMPWEAIDAFFRSNEPGHLSVPRPLTLEELQGRYGAIPVGQATIEGASPVPFRLSLQLRGPGQDALIVADEPGQKSTLISGGTTYTVALPCQPPAPAQRNGHQAKPRAQHGGPGLLTIQEAAQRTGLSRKTIYNMIRRGDLEAFKSGHTVRIYVESLQRGGADG